MKEDLFNNIAEPQLTDNKSLSDVEAKVSLMPTHADLVKIAEKWLYGTMKCGVVFTELVAMCSEIPDAFGLRSDYTILVECKTSRADFFADQKKIFRHIPENGVGDYRFYLCREGLISPNELPSKWGLLYWNGKQVKKIVAPKGNISHLWKDFRFEKSFHSEHRMLYSALRRIHLRGYLGLIYEKIEDASGRSN